MEGREAVKGYSGGKKLELLETGDADENVLRELREVEKSIQRTDNTEALEVTCQVNNASVTR